MEAYEWQKIVEISMQFNVEIHIVLKTAISGTLKLQICGTPKLFTLYCKLAR